MKHATYRSNRVEITISTLFDPEFPLSSHLNYIFQAENHFDLQTSDACNKEA